MTSDNNNIIDDENLEADYFDFPVNIDTNQLLIVYDNKLYFDLPKKINNLELSNYSITNIDEVEDIDGIQIKTNDYGNISQSIKYVLSPAMKNNNIIYYTSNSGFYYDLYEKVNDREYVNENSYFIFLAESDLHFNIENQNFYIPNVVRLNWDVRTSWVPDSDDNYINGSLEYWIYFNLTHKVEGEYVDVGYIFTNNQSNGDNNSMSEWNSEGKSGSTVEIEFYGTSAGDSFDKSSYLDYVSDYNDGNEKIVTLDEKESKENINFSIKINDLTIISFNNNSVSDLEFSSTSILDDCEEKFEIDINETSHDSSAYWEYDNFKYYS